MKKLTTIIALFFAVNAFGQKDSLVSPPIPDSVTFMSKRHIQQSYKNLETKLKGLENQLTVAQYNRIIEGIDAAFQELISVATEEYNRKKKSK